VKEDGQLAAVCIRVMLAFEPDEGAARIGQRLVEGHMRVVFSIPQHRKYLHAGTPSEPVLAEAAARIMNEPINGRSSRSLPLAMIRKYLDNGFVQRGERGELAARLLLTLAHDTCVDRSALHATPEEAHFSKPIHVLDFLAALVGPSHMDLIRQSRPDNTTNGMTLEMAFKDARINFTHFVQGGDDSILSDEVAWLALARSMAFQCANGHHMVDLDLPVLLWDEPLGRFIISGILVQVRNRTTNGRAQIDAEKLEFFTPSADDERANTRPYIAIVM